MDCQQTGVATDPHEPLVEKHKIGIMILTETGIWEEDERYINMTGHHSLFSSWSKTNRKEDAKEKAKNN